MPPSCEVISSSVYGRSSAVLLVRSPFSDRCSQVERGLSKTLPLVVRSPVKTKRRTVFRARKNYMYMHIYGVISPPNFELLFQHCCFQLLLVFTFQYPTSTIQHCPFIIQCAYFKSNVIRTCNILTQCSMCLYTVKNAICFQRNPTSLFSAFPINIHILLSNFFV